MFKKLLKKITKSPKKLIVSALLFAAIAAPVTVWAAWGPSRPVFDWNNPDDRKGSMTGPVFNSFINTPTYGDERNFTTASPAGTAQWRDGNTATPGQEIEVRVFIHNNANNATNEASHNHIGVAKDTRVRIAVPDGVANGFDVTGYVSASNATPRQVYDSTPITNANRAFDLEYVPGSAKIYNNGPWKNGRPLSDNVVGANGTPIGYDALNGELPGCFEYQAVVIIKLKVKAPELELKKQVTTPGSTQWGERVNAKVGDTVSWLITFNNKGTAVMNNVTIRDVLPKGVKLVPGSIMAFDVNRPEGQVLNDNALGAGGVNLGNYGVNGGGYIRFRTVVTEEIAPECMAKNVAFGRAQNVPEQSDDAVVIADDCEKPEPAFECESLSAQKISQRSYRFTARHAVANGAVFKHYVYDFGDGTEALVTDRNTVDHTYENVDTYTARVSVVAEVNGQEQTRTGDDCMVNITVGEEPSENCPIPGKEHLPKDSPECVTKLPETGVGGIAGIFAATTVAGMIAYRVVLGRQYR